MPAGIAVAVVSPMPPERGGISQSSRMLADALEGLGHAVTSITWRKHYPKRLYPGEAPSDPSPSTRQHRMLSWYNPLTWIRAGRIAATSDVVVFAWVTPWDAIPYWTVATVARTRSVAVIHNLKPHESMVMSKWLTRLFVRRLTACVTFSDFVATEVAHQFPNLTISANTLPGILAASQASGPPKRPPLLLIHPGFIRSYKGPDIAIEAVAMARTMGVDVRLRIVGDAWEDSHQLRALGHRLGLDGHLSLDTRYLSDDDLLAEIAGCHALLLPYRSATQSGLIPLALAIGRPVIVTDVGGLASQIRPGVNGMVAASTDAPAVAQAIVDLNNAYDQMDTTSHDDTTWAAIAHALIESGNAAAS